MYTSLAEDNDALNKEVARLRNLVRDAYFEGSKDGAKKKMLLERPATEWDWQNSRVRAKMNNEGADGNDQN